MFNSHFFGTAYYSHDLVALLQRLVHKLSATVAVRAQHDKPHGFGREGRVGDMAVRRLHFEIAKRATELVNDEDTRL